ncbi:heterokaryon incompatibility protein-domain-containing protein [Microdochium trichocladiopsis]|uniref:Heterokaryon incompatibility protein-domain-containing protein n=1 Tax=Microdochium trichocladiopsis TaxID=1682393 RepID=A0A9P8Y638_9PEZI|nr:heterokaryon incompatibility protein-domain-containing protein [Microdochium trichocladiopsis]KAH7031016.1 heterokaryon incompatibility protein-domain-containing protein [Microdochium trichocladiopsis]
MPRCSACSSGVRMPGEGPVRRWPSFNDLESSAASGCDVCTLCRQYLSNWIQRKALCDTLGDVRLYAYDDHFSLECPSLQGALNLPVEDIDKSRQNKPVSPSGHGVLETPSAWLQRCLTSHDVCDDTISWMQRVEGEAASNLPRRLIDLMNIDSVVIIDCADWLANDLASPADLRDYCTLSYRWGQTTHDYVLKTPFDVLLEMPLASMPQTFKDAFAVVRALGIRFLWIDALCIVQPTAGDDGDWLAEGPRMGAVYQNSVLTIAATCALHAHEGFLAQTGASVFAAEPCTTTRVVKEEDGTQKTKDVLMKTSTPDFFQCVSNSALNERGWVMQERALSKRVVHFTEHGIFWECGGLKAHNIYGGLGQQVDQGRCRHKESMISVARSKRTRHLCPVEWFHFVKQYSYAKFTNPQDRLMALSSVARAVQPVIGAEYLAGLWANDLIRGLEWHCFKPEPKPRTYAAPTWSWASVGSGIEFTALCWHTFYDKVVEVVGTDVRPSPGTDRYGEISTGKLKLRGTLDHRKFPETAPEEYDRHLKIYWDEMQCESPAHSGWRDYTVLPICGHSATGMTLGYDTMFGAIILEPIGDTKTNARGVLESITREYRRIGWVEYDCPDARMHSHLQRTEYFSLWKEKDPTEVIII